MSQDESDFQYFLAQKKYLLVITFVGSLDFTAVETLNKCIAEYQEMRDAKFVIFYLRDVTDVTGDGLGIFTQIQLEARARGQIRICSLSPAIKEKLLHMGVIRKSEIVNNMREALLSFLNPA